MKRSRTGMRLTAALILAVSGCHAQDPNQAAAPPKIAGMTSLLGSLRSRHGEGADHTTYVVTIAPTLSPGSVINYTSDARYGHEIRWSRDTIRRANAASVVEVIQRGGQIAHVEVETYHWHGDRWRPEAELIRELYPAQSAALEAILDRRLTTRPATRPASP